MNDFDLGILWATSSKIGDQWILRNEDPYFAAHLQRTNGGKVFTIKHDRTGALLYCLKIKRKLWEELLQSGYTGRTDKERNFPKVDDPAEFTHAYIQCHSSIDLWTHKIKSGKTIKTPRMRTHGAAEFLSTVSCILAREVNVGEKTVQRHSNGEMGVLYYQSPNEIRAICDWVTSGDHSPAFYDRAANCLKQGGIP